MDKGTIILCGALLVLALGAFALDARYHLRRHDQELKQRRLDERRQLEEAERSKSERTKEFWEELQIHRDQFQRRARRVVAVDDYGNRRYEPMEKEVEYFIVNVATSKSGWAEVDLDSVGGFIYGEWVDPVFEEFEGELQGRRTTRNSDGIEYERLVGAIFAGAGYSVTFTPPSGDQGVDLIAERRGARIAVQCKDYTGSVGNDAVQQVYAGARFYEAIEAIVVSPANFTAAALQLANSLRVRCLHHDDLLLVINSELVVNSAPLQL